MAKNIRTSNPGELEHGAPRTMRGDQTMNTSFLGIPGLAWGGACVGLAVLFAVLWPSRIASGGIGRAVLRWGHSSVWALLALWFFVRTWAADAGGVVNVLPLLAGLAYAVFMTTLVATAARTRSQREK